MEKFLIQAAVITVVLLFPFWRIFQRAGLNPLGALTIIIPFIGPVIAGLILALSSWKLSPQERGSE